MQKTVGNKNLWNLEGFLNFLPQLYVTLQMSYSSCALIQLMMVPLFNRAFPVAAALVWNSLPDLVTSAPSVAVFRSRLKTHLFNISYPSPLWLYSACAVTLSCFGHYNRSFLLTYLHLWPRYLFRDCGFPCGHFPSVCPLSIILSRELCRRHVLLSWTW